MNLLRASTLCVQSLEKSRSLYCNVFGYKAIENGKIDEQTAETWGAKKTEGLPYTLLQPESKSNVFLRLIENPKLTPNPPLRTFGWSAIEICTQDTLAIHAKLLSKPFEIIGPPKPLDGMPQIFPMQILGPDNEVIYLTEIRENFDEFDLPRANSLVDRLFILVMGCKDRVLTGNWLAHTLELKDNPPMKLAYTMLSKAYGMARQTQHTISTLQHERDLFLQIDQMPKAAVTRPQAPHHLPSGIAIGSFHHPDFDHVLSCAGKALISDPQILTGQMYAGKRSVTLKSPDGTLIEIIEK